MEKRTWCGGSRRVALLPELPNLFRNYRIILFRARTICAKPANKLFMHNLADAICRITVLKPGQDGPHFGFVFVRVRIEVDADGVVAEQHCRDLIEKFSVIRFKALAFSENLLAFPAHRVKVALWNCRCRAEVQG